jgi:hypothetical protein
VKYVEPRPFADPEAAARKLMELANAVEPLALDRELEAGAVFVRAALELGQERPVDLLDVDAAVLHRLWLHESGTYVKLTEAGAALFA